MCNVVTPPELVVVSDSELHFDIGIGGEDGEDIVSDQDRTCEFFSNQNVQQIEMKYNSMEDKFWQKIAYHFRKSNLLLVHE